MAPQKPTQYLNWNPTQSSVVQPPSTLRARGWQANEAPVAQHANFLFWLTDQWVQYFDNSLSSAVMTTTLDNSMRLIGGGNISFALATGTLTWTQPLTIAIPSLADSANVIAAGSLVLQPGQVAYTQANVPFSTSGDVTQGQSVVQNLAYEYGILPGQTVTGTGIPAGTTVVSVDSVSATLSNAATATGSQVTLTFSGVGPLTLQSANSASLVPSPNTVIIARATPLAVYLGINSGQMILRDGETRRLLEAGYHDVRYLPAGAALTANTPVFVAGTGALTAGAVYPCDASAAQGATRSLCIGFSTTAAASGATASVMTGGVLSGFTGLTQGAIYYLDPATPGGLTVTRPTGVAYAVPVGLALDTKSLYVRVASAAGAPLIDPSFNSVNIAPVTGDTNAVTLALKDAAGNSKFAVDAAGNQTLAGNQSTAGNQTVTGTASITGAASSNVSFTAPSIVSSASGFKTAIKTAYRQLDIPANQTTSFNFAEPNNFQAWNAIQPYAGSLVAASINYRWSVAQPTLPNVNIGINKGGSLVWAPVFNANNQAANADFALEKKQPKGAIPFAVDETFTMTGTVTFGAAATFYVNVTLWVELNS